MNIYLISSSSRFLIEDEIHSILKNNQNVTTYDASFTSISDILEEASYVSLFSTLRYMIIKNADFFATSKLKEEESMLLESYLEHPSQDTTLIFTINEIADKRKKITKMIIEQYKYIEKIPKKGYELYNEIKSYLTHYQIKEDVIKYLCESCNGNYDIIRNELLKFPLFFKEKDMITKEDLIHILGSNKNENIFKLISAIIEKDYEKTLLYYKDYCELKMDSLQLLMMLAKEYKNIYFYKLYTKKNMDVKKELKLQDWQLSKLRNYATLYDEEDLTDILLELSYLDKKIKSLQVDKTSIFYSFFVKMMEY